MRTPRSRLAALVGLFLALPAARSLAGELPGGTRPRPSTIPLEKTLTANEVMRYFDADYLPEVRDCYVQHAARQRNASGRLVLELIIRPVGTILMIDVDAPGVRGAKLQQCIRTASEDWHFPDRAGFTAVMIPVTLVKTHAPGAGPMKK